MISDAEAAGRGLATGPIGMNEYHVVNSPGCGSVLGMIASWTRSYIAGICQMSSRRT